MISAEEEGFCQGGPLDFAQKKFDILKLWMTRNTESEKWRG